VGPVRVLRALSLDVVAGAACGGLLAEQAAGARMPAGWWVALLLAVWCIYTGDHLLDARGRSLTPVAYRHAFHARHAGLLTIALAGCILAGLAAAGTLRPPVRIFGIGLSLAVVLYLASAQGLILPNLPKEPVAGILYAGGIWGGPILMGQGRTDRLLLATSFHALAAILNLAMVGVFEANVDRQGGHRSLALRWGRARAREWVVRAGLVGSGAALGAALVWPATEWVFGILAVQIAIPALALVGEGWFGKKERYRSWGDSVFLLGAVPRLAS
jgi:hypothetical protein